MNRSVPAAVVPLAVFIALLVGHWIPGPPNEASDSQVLVSGAQVALACLREGVLHGCGTSAEDLAGAREPYPVVRSAVAPFPLLQYLPAVTLLALGASPGQVLVGLSIVSVFAFLGVLGLLWATSTAAGRPAWAPALVLAAIVGPLLFYASSTFGEMLAAFHILLFVVAVARRAHWALVAGSLWLAGITKETALPFLLALGVVAAFALEREAPRWRSLAGGLALGAVAAVMTNAAFNLFRYGTVVNEEYFAGGNFTELYGIRSVPFPQRAEFLGGLLAAPNAGLLVFWPLAAIVLGAAGVAAALGWRRARRVADVWPALVLVGTLVVLLVGFASWYQPFGGFSWGPRLVVPWIPALLLLSVLRYGDELRGWLRPLVASRPALAATAAVVGLLALPQVAVARDPALAYVLFRSDDVCPWSHHDRLQGQNWFDCLDHVAWEKRPVLLTSLEGYRSSSRGSLLFLAALVAAIVGLLVLVRERVSGADERRAGPRSP